MYPAANLPYFAIYRRTTVNYRITVTKRKYGSTTVKARYVQDLYTQLSSKFGGNRGL